MDAPKITYRSLIEEHLAIEVTCNRVLTLCQSRTPQVAEAVRALEFLAAQLRDHFTNEDPVIYETLLAADKGRHARTAIAFSTELDALKAEWTQYLYRWDANNVRRDWTSFARESSEMIPRVRGRVQAETAVLYSLALHYEVIAA